jgi:transketolase
MGEQVTYSISESIESSTKMSVLYYYDKSVFDKLLNHKIDKINKTKLFSALARYNTLYMISRAGSGHIGGSFSSIDIISWLYLNEKKESDIYFSSKGHDAPGLYSIQSGLGIIPFNKIHSLRRIGGLPGHPDVNTEGAFTNTGSLGMGVSKAKGFLYSNKINKTNIDSRVFVLTGDGELQEGQFWESLMNLKQYPYYKNLIIIIDFNKIQSDTYVKEVSDLGDIELKLNAFGLEVYKINGHDLNEIDLTFQKINKNKNPSVIISDTIKGKGVDFMEHTAMGEDVYYKFHSGAPSKENYLIAMEQLQEQIYKLSDSIGINIPSPTEIEYQPLQISNDTERLIPAYSNAITKFSKQNSKIIALDADLVLDTGLIPFKEQFSERFIECGISEQDMVSQAGTIALSGLIPIVHSFACFLTTRPNEQIYNNALQGSKIIYVGSLAGLLPAGPGSSHQAVRDITTMSAIPNMIIIEPNNSIQVEQSLDFGINSTESTYLRINSIPLELNMERDKINLPKIGQGNVVRGGNDLTFLVLGPVLLNEVVKASKILQDNFGINSKIISTPWANRFDKKWYSEELPNNSKIIVVENHYLEGGFGEKISKFIKENDIAPQSKMFFLGIIEIPKCGTNIEVLNAHKLDHNSISLFAKNINE